MHVIVALMQIRPRSRPLLTRQDQNNKTKTIGSKQRHLVDLTLKYVNATVDLDSSDVPSTK